MVRVKLDVTELKEKIHESFPQEKDLKVRATHNTVSLSGRISSAANLSEVLALAKTYVPEGNVNNFIEVGGVHQVMLEVRVAEMSRNLGRRLGINLAYINGRDFGVSTLNNLSQINNINIEPKWQNTAKRSSGSYTNFEEGEPGNFFERTRTKTFQDGNLIEDKVVETKNEFSELNSGSFLTKSPLSLEATISDVVNALFRFHTGSASWTGFIDALKREGLVKVLAEPTLIAQSGQSAQFLAGGEFPIPVPDEDGITIEFKEFGVGLAFTPKVLEKGRINIQVQPEVSELDFSTAIQVSGFAVPGLRTRRAATTVDLADGQSFAIAGLLQENIQDTVDKFPWLGDIPVLGTLFRSKSFQKNETELVIIVTPHLVKPLDMAEQTLPTDHYQEPNDVEFYILGRMQGRTKENSSMMGEMDGEFGHVLPQAE